MKEYIERAAVHELLKRLPKYQMFSHDRAKSIMGINPDDVDFGVDKIPAADVAPVRHGSWVFDHMTGERAYCANCSECGYLGIELENVIAEKMDYNEGRPYKHGKRF